MLGWRSWEGDEVMEQSEQSEQSEQQSDTDKAKGKAQSKRGPKNLAFCWFVLDLMEQDPPQYKVKNAGWLQKLKVVSKAIRDVQNYAEEHKVNLDSDSQSGEVKRYGVRWDKDFEDAYASSGRPLDQPIGHIHFIRENGFSGIATAFDKALDEAIEIYRAKKPGSPLPSTFKDLEGLYQAIPDESTAAKHFSEQAKRKDLMQALSKTLKKLIKNGEMSLFQCMCCFEVLAVIYGKLRGDSAGNPEAFFVLANLMFDLKRYEAALMLLGLFQRQDKASFEQVLVQLDNYKQELGGVFRTHLGDFTSDIFEIIKADIGFLRSQTDDKDIEGSRGAFFEAFVEEVK
jgi:tetratricopeptide (TPR) repeat protein